MTWRVGAAVSAANDRVSSVSPQQWHADHLPLRTVIWQHCVLLLTYIPFHYIAMLGTRQVEEGNKEELRIDPFSTTRTCHGLK